MNSFCATLHAYHTDHTMLFHPTERSQGVLPGLGAKHLLKGETIYIQDRQALAQTLAMHCLCPFASIVLHADVLA